MADAQGIYKPYTEAKDPRAAFPTTGVSGSDTSQIDHLRQGVEITTDKYRYLGVYKIGAGENDHVLQTSVYGQPSEFEVVVPFEDLTDFDPTTHIENKDAAMFPIVRNNATFLDPERFGAFIEPLSVGARDFLLQTTEFAAHTIRAHLQDGNEDTFGKVDTIQSLINTKQHAQQRSMFVDTSDNVGSSGGSVMIAGETTNDEKLVYAFDDSKSHQRAFIATVVSQISGSLHVAVLAMTGSSTDEYVQKNELSMGKGFTYDLCQLGTDSLAFGGLKRS
jgi:hypothetical protein